MASSRAALSAALAIWIAIPCAQARPWTNTDGVTIEADLIEANDRFVVLQLPGGRRATYPLEKLILSDQEFARAAARKQAEAAAAAAKAEAERLARIPKPRAIPERIFVATPELAKIPRPADNSPAQIRKYIRQLLAFDPYAQNRSDDFRETSARELRTMLAGVDETNLDILIEETFAKKENVFPGAHLAARDAIKHLASEDSRELVRSLYPKYHGLSSLILSRSWADGLDSATLAHLKRVEEWTGATDIEADLVRLGLRSEDPRLHAELIRQCDRLPPSSLLDYTLTNLAENRREIGTDKFDELLLVRWNRVRKNATDDEIRLANAVISLGDMEALRFVAKLMAKPVATDSYLDYQLKQSAEIVRRRTDAPAGTIEEIGRWLAQNIGALSWDASAGRFVKR